MYSKNRTKLPNNLTLDWILSKVTEYDIYKAYLGIFKVGQIYNCPFRKDKNPSFGTFYTKRGEIKLMWKDFGTGESGDIIKLIKLLTNKDYQDILKDIADKLNIKNSTKSLVSSKHNIDYKNTIIGVVRQPFTNIDKEYWKSFHISMNTLKLFNVNSIKYYLCNGIVKGIYKDTNPMYSYKVNDKFKIYRPLADKYVKWRSNLDENNIQGYEQLPENGDLLIITKSLKDVMVLYEMGYNAISPSSETTFISKMTLDALLKRFKRVLLLYDRDVTGVKQTRSISLKTGLNGFFINKRFKSKDISDAVKNNSFEIIKKWLDKTVKNENTINKETIC